MQWCFGGIDWRFGPGEPTRLMGILNVTPDSFSDGGRYVGVEAAVRQGLALREAGADVIDVGGESTRPGAAPVSDEVETERVVPVVRALASAGVLVSIDTSKAAVAEAALDVGARIVNDVSALADARMAETISRFRAGLVLMHMRGTPQTMQQGDLRSPDIVADVSKFLENRIEIAVAAGVDFNSIVIDPGVGFGKSFEQNFELISGVRRFCELGRPVLLGLSRKSFLGRITGRSVDSRENASTAAHALSVYLGADMLRVHDVGAARDAVRVARAVSGELPA